MGDISVEDLRQFQLDRISHLSHEELIKVIEWTEERIRETPDGTALFFDPARFDWAAKLELSWSEIRFELDSLLGSANILPPFQDISKEQIGLTTDHRWKVFPFLAYGERIHANCRRCPETAAALDRVRGLTSAMFSILDGKKHIPPHRGPYSGVLRCHLGLRIPGRSARMRVGDEVMCWLEGSVVIFDDTHEHEVWNDCDEFRVVLFMDIERPLPPRLTELNRAIIGAMRRSSFIQQAVQRMDRWESVHGALLDERLLG